jgi:serine/threonine protein kinase
MLYCAPEVAQFKPRNTSSDIWSLGCVFLEMATVLAGFEVKDMQQFFRKTNDDYRFHSNSELIPRWTAIIRPKLLEDAPLRWVAGMLRFEPSERLSSTSLFSLITQKKSSSKDPVPLIFCGSCCEPQLTSDGSGSDGELWDQDHATTDHKTSKSFGRTFPEHHSRNSLESSAQTPEPKASHQSSARPDGQCAECVVKRDAGYNTREPRFCARRK